MQSKSSAEAFQFCEKENKQVHVATNDIMEINKYYDRELGEITFYQGE